MKKNLLFLVAINLILPHGGYSKIELIQHTPSVQEQYYFLALKGAHEHLAGCYQNAHDTYARLHTVTPDDYALMNAAIRLAFDTSKYTEVLSYADKIDPTLLRDKELTFLMAQAYLFLHKDQQGIELLEKLRALYPHDDRFDYFATIAYTKTGQHSTALNVITQVLANPAKRSRYYLFHFLKAKHLFAQSKLDEALHEVTASLVNNPSFAKGFFLKGAILEQQHDYKRALAAYQRYQALSSHDETITKKIEELRKQITPQASEAELFS